MVSIWRYPVKSLRGERLDRVELEPGGIPGDRGRALFVSAGHVRAGKTYRGKEHERLHVLDDAEAARFCAAGRGVTLEAVDGDHFFDAAPISLLVDRWLDGVSRHMGFDVEFSRFRPNVFVRAGRDFDRDETALGGTLLTVGDACLRVRGPITRCVTITYAPDGNSIQSGVLRYLARERNAWMGVYCDVLQPGTLAINDEVYVQPAPEL
ncbi:MAG TPA: MOSC domain-containing protein [Candidatus Tumulicola sp.]